MALVDDHEVEVVGRVALLEEGGGRGGLAGFRSVVRAAVRSGAACPVEAQRLVGGDEHPGVRLRVPAGDGGRVGPEDVLERAQRLVAELIAVDQEERPAQDAGIGEAAQEVNRDVRLAGAGREGQERTGLAASDLLEHRPDRGVLVVAPAGLAAAVRRAERAGQLRGQVQAAGCLPAHAELVRGGVVRHRGGGGRQAGRGVVFDPQVPVRAVDEGDVEAGGAPGVLAGVLLRLVQPSRGRRIRPLRLHDSDRDGLRGLADLDPQRVVSAAGARSSRPPVHDLDRPGRLLAPDQLLGPAGGVEGRVEQGDTGVAFERGHLANATRRAAGLRV